MPLEAGLPRIDERVRELNARYRHHAAADVLETALTDPMLGAAALVSSFGAEAVVLLHMVSRIDRTTPVLFADTGMLFEETLTYQQQVADRLNLTDVRRITPDPAELLVRDTDTILHVADTKACCALRKTEPLEQALQGFDTWITGRKRFQGGARATLPLFEAFEGRIKVNPLSAWSREDVADYMTNNRLPRHPLVAKGFTSLGCIPCTTPTAPGEDPRAGRWRGQDQTECGIHIPAQSSQLRRTPTP
ncbi:MAG: phosphoadenylyl-sulfate reductase [Pseudomonadota bacterium]